MFRLFQSERYPAAGRPGPPLCQINDLVLIRKAQRGDYTAFVALVRTYDLAVLRIAKRVAESEQAAAELYRRAFLRVYKNIGSYRFECSFYSWILRFVTHLCIEHLHERQMRGEGATARQDGRREESGFRDAEPLNRKGSQSAHPSRQDDFSRHVHEALKLLTPRERMILELKHGQGFPLRTASEILDIREEVARASLVRATEKLHTALAAEPVWDLNSDEEKEEKPA
jgi:RNA polymerase sigma-70 factor (ECF subfamily)